MSGISRRERGELQRKRYRSLVAASGSAPERGLTRLQDLERLAGPADWWSRQERWGPRVTGPARQLHTAIGSAGSSPNQAALLFELGRLALSFSQSVLGRMGPFPDAPGAAIPLPCRMCGAPASGHAWREFGLDLLRTRCGNCSGETTTSNHSGVRTWSWSAEERSIVLNDVKIAATDADPAVAYPGRAEAVSIAPGTTRVRLLLDLCPTEITWSRP